MTSWLVGIVVAVAVIAGGLALFSWVIQRGVERVAPPLGRFLDIDGQRIHYLDVGSGPPILMIHGLGGQMGNFTYALAGRLADDFRLIIVDRPGSGYSTRPRDARCNVRAQAATMAGVAAALGLERPLVVGHSLGGAIALALAIDHPQTVGGLALIAPFTQPQDEAPPMFRALDVRSPLLRTLIAWTAAVPMGVLRAEQIADAVFAPERPPDDFARKGGGVLSLRPKSYWNSSADMVVAGDDLPTMLERYGSLAGPVGMLYGTGDNLLDHCVHALKAKEQIPGLALELVPGGHMLPVTQPDAAARMIRSVAAAMPAVVPARPASA
ncbi:alpha/beta fold hydrolase [Chelatococcus reniformis]|uniref:Alpha/beta hydrolase n=1 Tax=Chelatococcus reniformis TaxID=1494448 RepID=A0A916TZY8_9HYPH|nr:alpha/beta hydrolase [Chelatococcus reniformis]GGC53645.1 alpha/beta hydrolase [Chelatococcus reniformis]